MFFPARPTVLATSLRTSAVALFLTLFASLCPAEVRLEQAPPLYEQSLRTRVQQFYSYMQLSQYADAAALVTKATRDNFQNTHRNPFLSFSLGTIRFEPAGSPAPKKAEVTVDLQVFPFGATATLHAAEATAWVQEGNNWYMEAPKPHVATFEELTKGGKQAKPEAPEEIKFATLQRDMGKLAIGEKGVALFAFKNSSNHPVTLEVTTYCDCLVVKNLKKQYQPGESAELRLEFDSKNYLDDYAQSVFVKSLPGGTTTKLLVNGFILRPGQEKPVEKPEKP